MPRIDGAHFSLHRDADPARCCSSAWDAFHNFQCSRKVKISHIADDGKKYGFCGQHDPIAKRDRERAKDNVKRAKREQAAERRRAATIREGLRTASDEQLMAECHRRGMILAIADNPNA